ncbi:uncharacterized protein LOC144090480 isoform X2 [Stigmatopora argus]
MQEKEAWRTLRGTWRDLQLQLQHKVATLDFSSLALDERCQVKRQTAQDQDHKNHDHYTMSSSKHRHRVGKTKHLVEHTWLNQDAVVPVCPRTLKPLRLQVHVQVIVPGCPLEDDAASLNSVHVQVIFPGCPLEDDASCMMWRL